MSTPISPDQSPTEATNQALVITLAALPHMDQEQLRDRTSADYARSVAVNWLLTARGRDKREAEEDTK